MAKNKTASASITDADIARAVRHRLARMAAAPKFRTPVDAKQEKS